MVIVISASNSPGNRDSAGTKSQSINPNPGDMGSLSGWGSTLGPAQDTKALKVIQMFALFNFA